MPTVKPKSISQHKMRRFLELQQAAKEFEQLKEEIKSMLKAKAPQQAGRYQVSISRSAGVRRPAWKDEFVKQAVQNCKLQGYDDAVSAEMANQAAETVIKNTKPGSDSYSISVIDTGEIV